MSHLDFVTFTLYHICILSYLHFVSFAFCLICILLYLQYVGFAFCQICILSFFCILSVCILSVCILSGYRSQVYSVVLLWSAFLEKKVRILTYFFKLGRKSLHLTCKVKVYAFILLSHAFIRHSVSIVAHTCMHVLCLELLRELHMTAVKCYLNSY